MINTFWYVLVANCCNEWLDHPKDRAMRCNHRDDNDHQHYYHHDDHHDHGHHDHEAYPKRAGVQHHHTHIPHLHPKLPLNLKQANQVCWQEEVTMLVSGCKQKKLLFFLTSTTNPQAFGRWCPNSSTCVMAEACHTQASGNGRCSFCCFIKEVLYLQKVRSQ